MRNGRSLQQDRDTYWFVFGGNAPLTTSGTQNETARHDDAPASGERLLASRVVVYCWALALTTVAAFASSLWANMGVSLVPDAATTVTLLAGFLMLLAPLRRRLRTTSKV